MTYDLTISKFWLMKKFQDSQWGSSRAWRPPRINFELHLFDFLIQLLWTWIDITHDTTVLHFVLVFYTPYKDLELKTAIGFFKSSKCQKALYKFQETLCRSSMHTLWVAPKHVSWLDSSETFVQMYLAWIKCFFLDSSCSLWILTYTQIPTWLF
jgi:hypothetical protein